MDISVVVPVFNEQDHIKHLVRWLLSNSAGKTIEVIVSDGGSTDNTLEIASLAGARAVRSPRKGRAAQMNYAASFATAPLLYFVHADCIPPKTYATDITGAVASGFVIGRYRTQFDSSKFVLKLNAFFTRFDLFMCYGGDQTLYCRTTLFHELGGYDVNMLIMEEYDFVARAKVKARYKIMAGRTIISARKYGNNSWWRVQRANYIMVQMFKKGASQKSMVLLYKQLLQLP